MKQKKKNKISKELHIQNIKEVFTPVHKTLLDKYHEVSNDAIKRNELKLAVLQEHTNAMDKKGRQVVEAENYCDLLKFDQSLVVPGLSHLSDSDTNIIKSIESLLLSKGLFNIAETLSVLRNKSQRVYGVHQSFKSLENSKSARTPTPAVIAQFKDEVKIWVINMYLNDRKQRKLEGLPIRHKKGNTLSADAWLLDLISREFILQRPPEGVELESTTRADGTLFGFPELPDSLNKSSISKRFIQECLKNI